jgi:predicted RNA-binding Zn-ribbon protein involved in translation (DUF1610 family)
MPLVAPVQPLEEAGAGSKRRPLPELETAGNGRDRERVELSMTANYESIEIIPALNGVRQHCPSCGWYFTVMSWLKREDEELVEARFQLWPDQVTEFCPNCGNRIERGEHGV